MSCEQRGAHRLAEQGEGTAWLARLACALLSCPLYLCECRRRLRSKGFADNPFIGTSILTSIGIQATASTASGCFSSSQAIILGFSAVQALQNMTSPRKTNWIEHMVASSVRGTYKTG